MSGGLEEAAFEDPTITLTEVVEVIKKLLQSKVRTGTVPLKWQTRLVLPKFKKGDYRVWSNYQVITLLQGAGKEDPNYC